MHSLSGALSIPSGERPRRAHTLRINGNDALYRSRTATSRFRSPKPQLPLAEQSVFSGLVVLRVATTRGVSVDVLSSG